MSGAAATSSPEPDDNFHYLTVETDCTSMLDISKFFSWLLRRDEKTEKIKLSNEQYNWIRLYVVAAHHLYDEICAWRKTELSDQHKQEVITAYMEHMDGLFGGSNGPPEMTDDQHICHMVLFFSAVNRIKDGMECVHAACVAMETNEFVIHALALEQSSFLLGVRQTYLDNFIAPLQEREQKNTLYNKSWDEIVECLRKRYVETDQGQASKQEGLNPQRDHEIGRAHV